MSKAGMTNRGVFIAGTDTEIGKTHITCLMLRQFRRAGINAVGMKPVASGMELVEGQWRNDDVEKIWQASERQIERTLVNQFAFEPFIAPHVAAARVGEVISIDPVHDAYTALQAQADIIIVEGAGGLMTPLNEQQTFVDLAGQLGLGVVLVVGIRLGCINHALLTQQAMLSAGLDCLGWVANYPQQDTPESPETIDSLRARLTAPMLGVIPWDKSGNAVQEIDLGWSGLFSGQENN